MSTPIGFVGLGNMGAAMARRLLAAGFDVTVYNRTPEKAEPRIEAGARRADTPADCVAADGVVMTVLADDRALDNVVFAEHGLLDRLGSGGLHVSLSTISPQTARRIAIAHAERDAGYVAAPVFGRPEAAAAGQLWVVLSGAAAAKERVKAMLAAFSQATFDFGDDPGAANTVKLAGNFIILSAMEAMAEAFAMAEKRGISRARLAELLTSTLFGCPAYRTYAPRVAEHRHSPAAFSLSLGLKDMRLVLEAADAAGGAPMPLASLLHDRLLALQAQGLGDLDWSALALAASKDAGID